MPRVVIDTNELVRGLFHAGSKQDKILRMISSGSIRLYYSTEMLEELLNVLKYPKIQKSFIVNLETVKAFLSFARRKGKLVIPQETNMCRDLKDNVVLGTAMAARGKDSVFLITGDDDLLELKGKVEGVEIVTSNEFLKGKYDSN